MNIIFPMGGLGSRLRNYGNKKPKPLVEVLGKTILEWSIKTIGIEGNIIFCCKTEHIEQFDLEKKLKEIIPNCKIVSINYQTEGAVQTILEAENMINTNEELLISDIDHFLIWDTTLFKKIIDEKKPDSCVMVFPEPQFSKKMSYVKVNKNGYVTESAEKIPISNIGTAGIHYFKKGSDFVYYGKKMIKENIKFNNEYYVTPIYNLLVQENKKIITFPIIKMWALGNPDELELFIKEYSNR